jgi:hypothetical protein
MNNTGTPAPAAAPASTPAAPQNNAPAPAPAGNNNTGAGNNSQIDNTQQNAPNWQGNGGGETQQNDPVADIMNVLTTGTGLESQNTPAPVNPQQQPVPQQQQQQNSNGDETNEYQRSIQQVSTFMRQSDIAPDLLDGIDREKLVEQIANGDSEGFFDALNTVGDNAMKNALGVVTQMMPVIAESIIRRAVEQAGAQNSSTDVWNSFVSANPDYSPFEKTIRPQLETAMKVPNATRDNVFTAISRLYAGFLNDTGNPKDEGNNEGTANSPFNLREYLET